MQVFSVSLFKIIALFDFTEKKHDLLRNHLFRKLENNLYELDETDRKPSTSITSSENIIC